VAFKFNPPVSLGAYTLKDFDPNGKWYLWQRREDWKKTSSPCWATWMSVRHVHRPRPKR